MKNQTSCLLSLFLLVITASLSALPMIEEDNHLPRVDARGTRADGDVNNASVTINADEDQIARGQGVAVAEENNQPTAAENEPRALTLEDFIAAAENFPDEGRLIIVHDEASNVSIQAQDGNDLGQNQEIIDELCRLIPAAKDQGFLEYNTSNSSSSSTRVDPLSAGRLRKILHRSDAAHQMTRADNNREQRDVTTIGRNLIVNVFGDDNDVRVLSKGAANVSKSSEPAEIDTFLENEICNNIYTRCLARVAEMSLGNIPPLEGSTVEETIKHEWNASLTMANEEEEKRKRELEEATREKQAAERKLDSSNARDHGKAYADKAYYNFEVKRLFERYVDARVQTARATTVAIKVKDSKQSEKAKAEINKALIKEKEAFDMFKAEEIKYIKLSLLQKGEAAAKEANEKIAKERILLQAKLDKKEIALQKREESLARERTALKQYEENLRLANIEVTEQASADIAPRAREREALAEEVARARESAALAEEALEKLTKENAELKGRISQNEKASQEKEEELKKQRIALKQHEENRIKEKIEEYIKKTDIATTEGRRNSFTNWSAALAHASSYAKFLGEISAITDENQQLLSQKWAAVINAEQAAEAYQNSWSWYWGWK